MQEKSSIININETIQGDVPKAKKFKSTFVKGLPEKINNVSIIVPISIGKSHCEGEEFNALLELLNDTFSNSKIIFVLASTLQQYTNQLYRMSASDALNKAKEDGLIWKKNHEFLIKKILTNNEDYEIKDWEKYKNSTNFSVKLKLISDKLEPLIDENKDEDFSRKFDSSAVSFFKSQTEDIRITKIVDSTLGIPLCLKYLKEECAIELLLADENHDYIIYPRPISGALDVTHEKFINADTLKYLQVKNKLVKEEKTPEKIYSGANKSLLFSKNKKKRKSEEENQHNLSEVSFLLSAESLIEAAVIVLRQPECHPTLRVKMAVAILEKICLSNPHSSKRFDNLNSNF